MNTYRIPGFTVALLWIVGGCAPPPASPSAPKVDAGAVARSVVLCKTTASELQAKLGEPTRDGILHGARVVSWIVDWDSPVKYLAVLLDEHAVVTDLYWDLPTEIPWAPASQCAGR